MKLIALLACCTMLTGAMSLAFAEESTDSATKSTASVKKSKKKKKTATQTGSTSTTSTSKKKPLIEQADENMSGQGYGLAGCGLGSIVFGDKPGMIQVVAATLNGTGYQTFGISTGTSNCKTDKGTVAKNASLYIVVNHDALAKDISRGSGESLENLSAIMGCQDSKMLGGKLQQNFDSIFSNKASAEDSSKKILNIIKSDSTLSQSCLSHVG